MYKKKLAKDYVIHSFITSRNSIKNTQVYKHIGLSINIALLLSLGESTQRIGRQGENRNTVT